jgi:LPXTG-site transpeptidase (sortase) family protein
MRWGVYITARLVRAGKNAWVRKWSFLILYVLVFGLSLGTLARLDLLPEPLPGEVIEAEERSPLIIESEESAQNPSGTVAAVAALSEVPVKIVAASIGLEVSVQNPVSTVIEALDQALLKGAVRYPTSAKLGEDGNVVIFGHSSYLPIVHNLNFRAFNGIQNLSLGDEIMVYSEGRVYIYAVERVEEASAEEDGIPLSVSGKKLTLATCDTFGEKSDRFVVTANFVRSHALSS